MHAMLCVCFSLFAAASPLRVGEAAVEIKSEDEMVIAGGIGVAFAKGQEGKLCGIDLFAADFFQTY